MRLYELAYACRFYEQSTGYDSSLKRFRAAVGSQLDPFNESHRLALFGWLNAWGCRQFAREHHATTASESLIRWSERWLSAMPEASVHLHEIDGEQLAALGTAYDDLRVALASTRRLSRDRISDIRYGATGAAKTLFALRPCVFPPWDDPIRKRLGYEDGARGFERYLGDVRGLLRDLASEAGSPVPQLPTIVGRRESSPPKLIDEYNWVVFTQGHAPPSVDVLRQWWDWAGSVPAPENSRDPA